MFSKTEALREGNVGRRILQSFNIKSRHLNRRGQKGYYKSKNNKSVGVDCIPNECLKNENAEYLLQRYFNACFKSQKVPTVWLRAIISPIPKSNKNDPRVPLNYRGISLLSCVSKIYTSIINTRLISFLDNNNLQVLVDEQVLSETK